MKTCTITIFNEKGGVGKTSLALSMLSYFNNPEMYSKGLLKKAVAIDMDPKQRSLTYATRVKPNHTVYDVLVGDVDINDAVVDSDFGYVIPGSRDLALLDSQMNVDEAESEAQRKEFIDNIVILKNKLKELKGFDYVIIDCPPGYEHIALSCMVAADYLIIPAKASMLSLFALSSLAPNVAKAREFNPSLKVAGVLLTQHNDRTNAAQAGREAAEKIAKTHFDAPVFKVAIRNATAVEDSYFMGVPIFLLPAGTPVREDYRRFMDELLEVIG